MSELSEIKKGSALREYAEALVWALALALVIRTFVVQSFTIPSGSMLQTIQIGDYLLVNKFVYGVKIPFTNKYLFRGEDPKVGDIIVFEYPRDPDTDYIKRVVGVPGDVLEMKDKKLYRNGQPVQEDYVQHTRRIRQFRPHPRACRFLLRHGRQPRQFSRLARLGLRTAFGHPRQGMALLLVVGLFYQYATLEPHRPQRPLMRPSCPSLLLRAGLCGSSWFSAFSFLPPALRDGA